jgi:phage anti-repressor protein
MDQIIKIHNENGYYPINARELWETLKINTKFNDWISRQIKDYGFIKGKDFYSYLSKSTGGRPSKEYWLTINAGKELAIVEKNDIGRNVRQYLIKVEEHYHQLIDPKNDEIRQIAKEKRVSFTDALMKHGANKRHHFINITKGMKKCLGIPETKPKSECNELEVMAISISEDLATLSIIKNNPQGYYECRDTSYLAAEKVNQLTSFDNQLLN